MALSIVRGAALKGTKGGGIEKGRTAVRIVERGAWAGGCWFSI